MTSITHRIGALFRIKAGKALDRAEDPRDVLDYSYERQRELLQKVRRGLTDVATSRKRVGLQEDQLRQSTGKLEDQAQQALAVGREDLAREALTRRTTAASKIIELQEQQTSLQAQEEKLGVAAQRLQAQVDSFRTRKETLKASYTSAEARTRISEAVSGVGEDMGEVGLAVQRAEDKTEQMQARAGALDELIDSGALEDATLPAGRDAIQDELAHMSADQDVEIELARMKAQLPAAPGPPERGGPGATKSGPEEEEPS